MGDLAPILQNLLVTAPAVGVAILFFHWLLRAKLGKNGETKEILNRLTETVAANNAMLTLINERLNDAVSHGADDHKDLEVALARVEEQLKAANR